MKPLHISSEAWSDLDEALQWYAKRGSHLPRQLITDVEQTIEKISQRPEHGMRYPRRNERFWRTQRFPYLIIYEVRTSELFIIAIAHERRKPGFWRGR